jgi:PAS domain S-box-containing protein
VINPRSSSAPIGNSRFADPLRLGLIAIAYASAIILALIVPRDGPILAPIWPPSGVALAALLLSPRPKWRAILAVIFVTGNLVSLFCGELTLAVTGFMMVNVIEMWTCAWLMTRLCQRRVMFTRVGDVVALAVCAYVVNGVFALIGAAIASAESSKPFKEFFLTWWITDGLGILIVTPVVIAYAQHWSWSVVGRWRRVTEAAALGLVVFACVWLGFHGTLEGMPVIPRPYWICVPLVWAALRFGIKGTTVLLTVLTVIAIGLTTTGRSDFPLGGRDFGERLHMVQFFLSVMALTGLVLAAVVDERQNAREALGKLSRIVEQAPISILITGITGVIEYVNPRFCAVTGYTPEEMLGQNLWMRESGEMPSEVSRDIWQTIASGKVWTGDVRNRKKNGEVYLETAVIAPVVNESRHVTHYVEFKDDVTAQRHFEAESKAMLEKEHEVSEMKTRFISVTSHEFRTPMAVATGSVELLHKHFDRLTAGKREELFNRIGTSFQDMNRMLDDVLTLNRMDAVGFKVRLAPVDLPGLIKDIIEEIKLADGDAHRFEIHVMSDFPLFVTDMNLMRHVLSNLLRNAVNYSPAGTLITVRAEADSRDMKLSIEDQGIGILPSDLSRIFQPFERGSNVGSVKGTGLGLSIVKQMTELLGGTIAIDSVKNRGSRFTLIHPRPDSPEAGSPIA